LIEKNFSALNLEQKERASNIRLKKFLLLFTTNLNQSILGNIFKSQSKFDFKETVVDIFKVGILKVDIFKVDILMVDTKIAFYVDKKGIGF